MPTISNTVEKRYPRKGKMLVIALILTGVIGLLGITCIGGIGAVFWYGDSAAQLPVPPDAWPRGTATSRGLMQVGMVRGWVTGLATERSLLYAAEPGGDVRLFDISQPATPKTLGYYSTRTIMGMGSQPTNIAVCNQVAHIICNIGGAQYQLIDFSNNNKPTRKFIIDYAEDWRPIDTTIVGNIACTTGFTSGVLITDMSDSASPTRLATYTSKNDSFYGGITSQGSTVYLFAARKWPEFDGGRLEIIDISKPRKPQVLGVCQLFGEDPAINKTSEQAFKEASEPSHIENNQVNAIMDGWYVQIRIAGHYAFIAGGDHGLCIVDVANPKKPKVVGRVEGGGSALSVAISGDVAFVAGSVPEKFRSGLKMYDVSKPSDPKICSYFFADGSPSAVVCVGKEIYFGTAGQNSALFVLRQAEVISSGRVHGAFAVTASKDDAYFVCHRLTQPDGNLVAVSAILRKKDVDDTRLKLLAMGRSVKYGGYWKVCDGKMGAIVYRDRSGKAIASVEIKGEIYWTESGVVSEGIDNLINIRTVQDGKEVKEVIVKRKQIAGGVEITTAKGSTYVLSEFTYDFEMTIRKTSGE